MVTNTLHANALPDDFANRIGRLIESRGDVVDALFDPAALPDLLTELTVSDKARKDGVKIHVMRRPGGGLARGLAAALTTRDAWATHLPSWFTASRLRSASNSLQNITRLDFSSAQTSAPISSHRS